MASAGKRVPGSNAKWLRAVAHQLEALVTQCSALPAYMIKHKSVYACLEQRHSQCAGAFWPGQALWAAQLPLLLPGAGVQLASAGHAPAQRRPFERVGMFTAAARLQPAGAGNLGTPAACASGLPQHPLTRLQRFAMRKLSVATA